MEFWDSKKIANNPEDLINIYTEGHKLTINQETMDCMLKGLHKTTNDVVDMVSPKLKSNHWNPTE